MIQEKKKSATDIKRELGAVETELNDILAVQWKYIKEMMRFGMVAWIFGLVVFFFVLVIIFPEIILEASLVAVPLLIVAAAVPPSVTAFTARRFTHRITRLERIRHGLLMQYERAVLERIEREIRV